MTNFPTSEINKQIFSFFRFFKDMFSNAQFENFIIFILGLLQDSKHKKIATKACEQTCKRGEVKHVRFINLVLLNDE